MSPRISPNWTSQSSMPKRRCGPHSITSSATGSPEKQKINNDEGCDYATGAEGEHVANVVVR
jgi:hypothetical protein